MIKTALKSVAWTLAFAVLEWLAIATTKDGTHVVVLRPVAGVLAGICLLVSGRRAIKFLVAAAAGTTLARAFAFGINPVFLPIGLVVTGCSWAACRLTQRLIGPRITFGRWRESLGFITICTLVAIPCGFIFAGVVRFSAEPDFLRNALSWSLSTALSCSIFAPVVVISMQGRAGAFASRARPLMLSSLIMAAVLLLCFTTSTVPFLFLLPIAIVVVALIAEIEGAALALAATSVVALAATGAGYGPLPRLFESRPTQIMVMEVFLALLTVTLLPVAAALSEREKLKKKLESAVQESRRNAALLHQIVDAVDDHAIIMLDAEGRIATWNRGAERINGYSADEIVGEHIRCFYPPDARAAGTPERLLKAAAESDHVADEGWRVRMDGSRFWAGLSLHAMRGAGGELLGYSKVTRDLTARKAHEDALAIAKEEAQAAAQAKADFLANMSHEIRTPLTSVIGFSDLLWERADLDEVAQGFVSRIRDGSRALLALVNDILDFSKIESGQIDLRPAPVEPMLLAHDVVQLLALQAEEKGLALHPVCVQGLAGRAVMMDAARMRQVLINYVGNAVKFTDRGAVELSVSLIEQDDGTARLRFAVRDTGPGIAPDQQEKLFHRFSQLDSSAGKQHGGTGLGLAICKGIAIAMKGEVGVVSAPGEGATFWIEIPTVMARAVPTPKPNGAQGSERPSLLVADDHDVNLTLVKMALADQAEVTVVHDGREAVKLVQEKSFDLILLDIRMPEMGGVEAMGEIRKALGASAPPLIAFTAENDEANLESLIQAGFDATIAKPLSVETLRRCVRDKCGRAGALSEGAGRDVA
ncbi:MAG: response regulator [Proteobacteria bacterium]|nr:response regulator [Pseudomonadota bacterium]